MKKITLFSFCFVVLTGISIAVLPPEARIKIFNAGSNLLSKQQGTNTLASTSTNSIAGQTNYSNDPPPPMPEPIDDSGTKLASIVLWDLEDNVREASVDGINSMIVNSPPGLTSSFHVNQKIDIPIPHLSKTLTAELKSTHNQLGNVHVFNGPIINGADKDNVIITRGEITTYVIAATSEGVFTAAINNATGKTVITSEADINENNVQYEDGVSVKGIEIQPPEHSS